MVNYRLKYKKYKREYLKLKSIYGGNMYNLLHFDDTDKQVEFINKNKDKIMNLLKMCYTPQIELDEVGMDYFEKILNSTIYKKWFFAITDDDTIVGFFTLYNSNPFLQSSENIKTYEEFNVSIYDFNTTRWISVGPVIYAVCKDANYKNVGKFLFDKSSEYLRDRYNIIYLVPESMRYKSMKKMIDNNNCSFFDNYTDSNEQLVAYYKKVGFNISKDLYEIEKCNNDPEDKKYIAYNVMYKKLK